MSTTMPVMPGAQQKVLDYIDSMTIVDTHEHLSDEADRLKQEVDFSTMFSHYCTSDFISAGMSKDDHARLNNPKTPLDEKWAIFAPYWEHIRDGSYARAARIAMEKFYGYDDLTSMADAEAVTERIRANNTAGLYDRVLKDACKLRTSFNFGGGISKDSHLMSVQFVSGLACPRSAGDLAACAREMACDLPTTLPRYVDALGAFLARRKEEGLAGVKFHLAYERDLEFSAATSHEAEQVFDRVYEESQGWRPVVLGYEETRPLQNYLVHRIAELSGDVGLPVVFHTGMQAGFENRPDNCRPERLWNLIYRYPEDDVHPPAQRLPLVRGGRHAGQVLRQRVSRHGVGSHHVVGDFLPRAEGVGGHGPAEQGPSASGETTAWWRRSTAT